MKEVIWTIITKTPVLIVKFILVLIAALIKLVTYEPGKDGEITVRKLRRVRVLTKFKIWALNAMPDFLCRYLEMDECRDRLNKHFTYVV